MCLFYENSESTKVREQAKSMPESNGKNGFQLTFDFIEKEVTISRSTRYQSGGFGVMTKAPKSKKSERILPLSQVARTQKWY